ncbi:MAG: hypothetical protein R3C99_20460 [Pirellulaceae bacterium]
MPQSGAHLAQGQTETYDSRRKGNCGAMTARFLAILMTISLPLQGLAVPHCHGESISGQSPDHGKTPHIHFGEGHHHGEHGHHHGEHGHSLPNVNGSGDQSNDLSLTPTEQHDNDAVFVMSDLVVDHTRVRAPTCDLAVALVVDVVSHCLARDTFRRWVLEPPPDIGGLPIFLNTASLRL